MLKAIMQGSVTDTSTDQLTKHQIKAIINTLKSKSKQDMLFDFDSYLNKQYGPNIPITNNHRYAPSDLLKAVDLSSYMELYNLWLTPKLAEELILLKSLYYNREEVDALLVLLKDY
jgi:hypothetical protein